MIVTEPILLLMSLYIALIYGLLYAFFFSFPVVFGEDYRWNDGLAGLTFCSVLIGLGIALFVTPRIERDYLARAEAKGGHADPEDRLPGMMIGCWFVPISLFIFGWTSPPYVAPGGGNWVGPVSSGIPFGFGSEWSLFFSRWRAVLTGSCSSGHHLLLRERVPHRRLPWLRCLRACGQDGYPFGVGRGDAAVHHRHVSQPRQRLGGVNVGVHLPCYGECIRRPPGVVY